MSAPGPIFPPAGKRERPSPGSRRGKRENAVIGAKKWSGRPESNRRSQLGKLEHNHFATPASEKSACNKILPNGEKSSAVRSFSQKSCLAGCQVFYYSMQNFSQSNIASNRPERPFPSIFRIFPSFFSRTHAHALEKTPFPWYIIRQNKPQKPFTT